MNRLEYDHPWGGKVDIFQCGIIMSNQHIYECKLLNGFDKKVHSNKIFYWRLTEMQYLHCEDVRRKYEKKVLNHPGSQP